MANPKKRRPAIAVVENGKHDPSLPLAFKIARVFELPIEDIFHVDEAS